MHENQTKIRNIVIITVIVIGTLMAAHLWGKFWNHKKYVGTEGVLGRISVAISKTLSEEKWEKGYSPVEETKKMFPNSKIKDGCLVDAWGNRIDIEIKKKENAFVMTISSPGKDSRYGSDDDQVISARLRM